MSLIDREALIAEYDRVHIGQPGGARKLMEDAPTIEPKPQWIPVTERLPDSPIRVLIQIDNGWIITAYYDYGYDDENKFWWSVPDWDVDGDGTYALPISNQVLAWLPLPEPWKGEAE